MSNFNFDPGFFRRVITKCDSTEKIPSVCQLMKEATEAFYDEFDYYPDIGVYAPGTFTIMGDHTDYLKGYLIQAALPMVTVVVGKSLNMAKCRIVTISKDGLKKAVFPVSYSKKNVKIYPEWVNLVKGIVSSYPCEDLKGFDALIHSSVPKRQNNGSDAALEVAIYTFLDAVTGKKSCQDLENKALLCQKAEESLHMCENGLRQWDSFTSSIAVERAGVKINCSKTKASTFDMRDTDITFLLTYPNFNLELDDRDYILRRQAEVKLAAKLIGLENLEDLSERHLEVLENMEDPSKKTVKEILQTFEMDEESITEFVDELFHFPQPISDFEDQLLMAEASYHEIEKMNDFEDEKAKGKEKESEIELEKTTEEEKTAGEEKTTEEENKEKKANKKKENSSRVPTASYIQQRLDELCACRADSQIKLPITTCKKINCLGGIENLSVDSSLTVTGRLLQRLRHVLTEKLRCLTLPSIISQLDYVEFGSKLIESHLSLKVDYEVSCAILDNLVQLAMDTDRVYGAKMMSGGGTLTLLHRNAVEEFIEKITDKFGQSFQFYLVLPSSGAKIINLGVRNNPKSALSNTYPSCNELLKKAIENFQATYKYKPSHGAYSPGTLNLIGDHTDYNHGFCLCMAVNMLTVVVGAFNGTSKVRAVTTGDVGQEPKKVIFEIPVVKELAPIKTKWAKLVRGAIINFKGTLKGFDCLIESIVPGSSGISSKTALVAALYTFLESLTGQVTTDLCQKAHRCMLAEHESSSTVSGISNHTVSVKSKEDFVLLIDCKFVTTTFIPFQDTSVVLVLLYQKNAKKKNRALLYTRMEECNEVAKACGGKTLRCLNINNLDALDTSKVSETSIKRARHVITENERVLKAAEALKNNDFEIFGELMVSSHISLRDNFEVTTKELDFFVERAMEVDGILGSKMSCSEYDSCTLSLVKRWATDDFIEYMQNNSSTPLSFYIVNPYSSCNALNVKECLATFPSTEIVFENIFPF